MSRESDKAFRKKMIPKSVEKLKKFGISFDESTVLLRARDFKDIRYRGEFTFRCSRPSGIPEELDKIVRGSWNYYFYGFGDALEENLVSWLILDLNIFREWFANNPTKCKEKENKDGSSHFKIFEVGDMPKEAIVENVYLQEPPKSALQAKPHPKVFWPDYKIGGRV